MNKSESIKNIMAALNKFQGMNIRVIKDAENPFFNSKYASLTGILDAIQEPLTKCGLTISHFPDGNSLTTLLYHESGEWIESSYDLNPVKKDPQGYGSAITYAKRYTIGSILLLNIEEDDGGHSSSEPGLDDVISKVRRCKTVKEITSLWRANPGYKTNEDFVAEVKKRKEEIDGLVNARN